MIKTSTVSNELVFLLQEAVNEIGNGHTLEASVILDEVLMVLKASISRDLVKRHPRVRQP